MNDNIMSKEEIEEMLKGAGQIDADDAGAENSAKDEVAEATAAEEEAAPAEATQFKNEDYLSKEEQDVLGEIGNICMGTSATTMYTLLGKRVNITTPVITVHNPRSLAKEYKAPMVVVEVEYIKGISGKNLLILNELDVALMTDVLMGGDGSGVDRDNIVLDEMHMSAIREVMNQMVGSSATSLANIINTTVDISTPDAHHISIDEEELKAMFTPDDVLVKISFDMEIEGLLSSKIMQILPIDFARTLADKLLGRESDDAKISLEAEDIANNAQAHAPDAGNSKPQETAPSAVSKPAPAMAPTPAPAMPPQGGTGMVQAATNNVVRSGVAAQEVEYPSFDSIVGPGYAAVPENIALLSNVPMRVTVQLGKAKKKVKEILEFNNGSVIVLDKLAGEPVDILVNGKHIAKGEVVVVDDSYGVRITEIDSAAINETI